MRAALDTNLLVYAEGFGDEARVSATRRLLDQLSEADLVMPLQCLGELFRVLTSGQN
jgi:predicted nucleic acid-binding protein